MVLRQLQRLLEGIYDVPSVHDVDNFLFTDRARLPPELQSHPADEQVLVAEHEGAAAIGLFLDAGVLQRLSDANPLETLHGGNLADFLTALEGVSHFMYLAWNAGHDRPVSLLELELQAEIDKYVSSLWLLRAQQPARFPLELHRLLFERAHVDATLAGERAGMYARANRYAARFCRRVERCLGPEHVATGAEVVTELRRFYRWGSARKCRHIEQLA
jgi:hypothetical protein